MINDSSVNQSMINETGLAEWWSAVSRAALFGTARRTPPDPPADLPLQRVDGTPETALLDAAAIGGALVRAGSWPLVGAVRDLEPAGPDELKEPPARATQLLDLIITQSPAGRQLQKPLLARWLQAAATTGCHAPRRRLPVLLDLATGDEQFQRPVAAIADARGRWMAGLRSDWAWLATAGNDHLEPNQWLHLPTLERAVIVRRLRSTDPAAGRELVVRALPTDAAADRATLIECLRVGLGPADEAVLESALDDRSHQVRQVAANLLDRLPGSARATRMAARLQKLITVRGLINKTLTVRLPDPPDDAGVRDGLGRPAMRRSERGYWLEQLASGAPLTVWTDATGKDPDRTLSMINDDDALAGIRRAVLAQSDATWARSLTRRLDSPDLLVLLPDTERDALAAERIQDQTDFGRVTAMINALPTPWGPSFSQAVIDAADRTAGAALAPMITTLAYGLHPSVLPRLREFADVRRGHTEAETARNLVQYLTLTDVIPEAFL